MRLVNAGLGHEVADWNRGAEPLSSTQPVSACVAGVANVWSEAKHTVSLVSKGGIPETLTGKVQPENTHRVQTIYEPPEAVKVALLQGIQNRQGLVAVRAAHGVRVFPTLSDHLTQREHALVLADGVYLHALDAKNPEGLNGHLWHAVVSVRCDFPKRGTDLFSVPVSEITHEAFDANPNGVCEFHQQQVTRLLPAEGFLSAFPPIPSFIRERIPSTQPTSTPIKKELEVGSSSFKPLRPHHAPKTNLSKHLAYQERQLERHCGVSAINTFLQTKQVTSVHAVKQVIETYLSLFPENQRARLPGLFHPRVLNAVQRGQSVDISRAAFFGEYAPTAHRVVIKPDGPRRPHLLDEMYPLPATGITETRSSKHIERDRLEAQWKSFFDNHFEKNNQEGWTQPEQTIRINPSRWVSVFGGLGLEHVENLLNEALQNAHDPTTRQAETGFTLPKRISAMVPDLASSPRVYHKLKTAADGYKTQQLMFLVGTNIEQAHYITLVRDIHNDWLLLDSLPSNTPEGIHPAPVFSESKDLPEQLLAYSEHTPILRLIADERVITALNT